MPLGQVDLPVTFGDLSNFRTETLTFEVIDFPRSYHAILGRPCYMKFMAVPNYTCLKLKMPRPKGVITVGASFRVAYMCEQTCVELASAIMATAELADFRKEVSESPSSPRRTLGRSVSTPTTTRNGYASGQCSPPHRKARSSTSCTLIRMSSHGSLLTCQESRGRSPSTPCT